MAFLIAIFSAVYALVFAYFDATTYMPLIVINVLLMAIAILCRSPTASTTSPARW
jgi:hypothetical protein